MRKLLPFALILAALPSVASNAGFGLDAFNRAVSASARGNAVFSPISFELDCVIISEAFGALTRAKFAETMGVLNGLENVYHPVHEELSRDGHAFSMLTARAFCLPDERKAHPTYRQWIQHSFAAEAFTFDFKKGAECWFRARLDGEAEDFSLPDNAASPSHYSYYDVVYFKCPWTDSFLSNGVSKAVFHCEDGADITIPTMRGTRAADVWARKRYSLIRLPLADSMWFFAMLPREGCSVREIRGELNSQTFTDIVAGIKSITQTGISHGNTLVSIPVIDMVSESDLKSPFGYFRFPMTGMDRLQAGLQPRYIRQRVRFRLDETGAAGTRIEQENELVAIPAAETQKFVLDRPFVFFVLHEPTMTVPIVGQFMGK